MSSHREAPEIAKDPVADSTDVYAFVSPDHPDTVTLIANYVPLQLPAGPIVVHVRDVRSGDIEVFSGTSQTSLRDQDLAARIARAIG